MGTFFFFLCPRFYYVYLLTEQLILPLSVNAHYTGRILVSSFIDIAKQPFSSFLVAIFSSLFPDTNPQ